MPSRGRRRGPLHQRVGPRLPPRLHADRRAPGPAARGSPPGLHRHGHARGARRDPRAARPARRHAPARARLRAAQPRLSSAPDAGQGRAGGPRRRGPGRNPHRPRRRTPAPPSSTPPPAARPRRRPAGSPAPVGTPPPTTPAWTVDARESVQRAFARWRPGDRRRHQRLRHGHRPRRRALPRPPGPARLGGGLLPGGRPRRPRRRRRPLPAADLAGRHGVAPPPDRERRGGPGPRPGDGRSPLEPVPRADALVRGRRLPPRRHPALFRRRGGDPGRLRPLRRLPRCWTTAAAPTPTR